MKLRSLAPPCGLLTALAAGLLPTGALAQSDWGGIFSALTLTSDYRYQGVSNSDGPALQGYVHWQRRDGLYAGLFATQVDFDDGSGGPTYELDLYGGKHLDLKDGKTRLTVEAMFTAFPDEHVWGPTYNFVQLKAAARRTDGPWTLAATTSFVPEASYGAGQAWRLEGEAAYAVRPGLTLNAGLGRRWVERGQDRTYWTLGGAATWKQVTFELRYEDTDLGRAKCGFSDRCDAALIGALRLPLPPIT
ncbi:MAG: hypothetical protein C0481_17425 [Phenylobacterium sp.]|uniref:TorF family putative porin n=1 Tax=Phenylobacterium sp. TaxID=1871053 RepID=UPI0025CD4375|nr:TorF family putative porin [Phenylobacterium sp.]MBA4013644.1 hypothetical protein [Phenylobacterium sp.]